MNQPADFYERVTERELAVGDEWHDDDAQVAELGAWLAERMDFTAEDLEQYRARPWRWSAEREQMLEEKRGGK